jgi:DNA-binding response OmpR family regulator
MSMPKRAQRPLVLAVDDHPSILRFLKTGLEMREMRVITATSGEEALRVVESAQPSIVLLDIVMPGMGGLEALRKLRAVSQIPVVAFSANEEARGVALRLGANDFVSKPFDTEEMVLRIKTLLDNCTWSLRNRFAGDAN